MGEIVSSQSSVVSRKEMGFGGFGAHTTMVPEGRRQRDKKRCDRIM
jgi:hypothetical protein